MKREANESSFFKLPCPAADRDKCKWFHEEWSIPRYYMKDITIKDDGSLRMKARTDNSGTWRVKYGEFETVYHVSESDLLAQIITAFQ